MGTILLTGATGFLGAHIAFRLVKETNHNIAALVRADDREAAVRRLSRAWWDWPELIQALGGRVKVITGDVSEPHLGLGEADYRELARVVTHVIHTAADLRLNAPLNELRKTNVNGTANVLQFAQDVHRDHGLARLSHVSTAYVAGGKQAQFPKTLSVTSMVSTATMKCPNTKVRSSCSKPGVNYRFLCSAPVWWWEIPRQAL